MSTRRSHAPRDLVYAVRVMPSSIPGVVDVVVFRGARAAADAAPDLLVEVPHGATRSEDFTALAAQLQSPLPEGLADFFHVNTDVGAPELAEALAARVVADDPTRTALVLRCRVPRTFIDCNRRIDAAPSDFKAGRVTPGLMPWITHPDDRALLLERYDRYVACVRDAVARTMPRGAMVMMHSYAPRSVDVEVDADIVKNLRRAYLPEVEPTWPLRPEVDVIARALDGRVFVPEAVLTALRVGLAQVGVTMALSATYPMHPSTLAYAHAEAWPGRTLCVEVRRDLVADPFDPFVEMTIGATKVARFTDALAAAVRAFG